TQKMRRAILERFREQHGDKRIALLPREFIARTLGKKKPFAARNWLKTLRGFMEFVVAENFRADDPTQGVKLPRANAGGFHTWTEAEIAQFEARHPVGTRARLALALLLYTAQARVDVIGIGPQHVRGGEIMLRRQKTGRGRQIPLHTELCRVLDATPAGHLTYLVTENGKPFTAAGFGNWFRDRCDEAGLSHCSSHGLRHAEGDRLARDSCTESQIAAI